MRGSLGFLSIMMMTLATVANTRNISASYAFSEGVFGYYAVVCFLFFIPASLLVSVCTACFPSDQGIFDWVQRALGPAWAAVAVWLQWLENVFYYPLSLLFIISSIAQALHWELDPWTLCLATNVIFWALTWINMRGVAYSSQWVAWITLLGVFVPLALLMYATLDAQAYAPNLPAADVHGVRDALLISLASFLGVEINTVHASSVKTPKYLPMAILCGALAVLLCMVLGVGCMLFWLKGAPATVGNALAYALDQALSPLLGSAAASWVVMLMLLGPLGGMMVWILGPVYALHHMLTSMMPERLVPNQSLLLCFQAALVSCLSFFYFFFDLYDLFIFMNDAMVGVYLIMYFLFFLSIWRLRCSSQFLSWMWVRFLCILGGVSCILGEILCLWSPHLSFSAFVIECMCVFLCVGLPYVFFRSVKTI